MSQEDASFNIFVRLWKTSNLERTSDDPIRITNLIKDVMNLAKKHNIKEKLYIRDDLRRIYPLSGDEKLLRW